MIVLVLVLLGVGCGDDEEGQGGETPDCGEQECSPCQESAECELGTICDEEHGVCVVARCGGGEECPQGTRCESESGRCVAQECSPEDRICEDGAVYQCDGEGAGFEQIEVCEDGLCSAGACGCATDGDCPGQQQCLAGACGCPDGVGCGTRCCGDGEECATIEICDGDDCDEIQQCRLACDGEFCGFDGTICCEGDSPACGPLGECAPACEGDAELCGEEFDECCPAGDVCVFGACRTPGGACEVFSDCGFDEYCDQGLQRCMPDDFPEGLVCELDVDFDPFDVEELWHWDGIVIDDRLYDKVQSIPVTAEVVPNGHPEIVITPYHGGDQHNGILAVVSGQTGETVYFNDRRTFSGQGHIAVADVTGDGLPEIVAVLGDGDLGVAMVENPSNCPVPEEDPDECIRWEVRSGTLDRQAGGMGPLIADLNGDGQAEVVVGTMVIAGATGEVIADGTDSSRAQNGLGNWGASTVVDLDGDGTLELLTGDCAWKVNFEEERLDEFWCNDEFNNGIPAVADIVSHGERAGMPEVAVVRSGTLRILDGQSGETLYTIEIPGGGDGGSPNIADFDGDGTVEIGLPGRECYAVFDLACLDDFDGPGECEQPTFPECTPGEDCLVDPCEADGLEGGSGPGVLWSIAVQDRSMTTGSSVFDFQGNQRNEVVYNDECRLLVLDGQTGQPLISRINTTRTATEYPLVVDINGDGRSNIAVIANNDQYGRDCEDLLDPDSGDVRPDWFPECFPDDPEDRPEACDVGTSGVFAFQDVNDAWVSTRAVWNQHAYHITNINDDATLPTAWENPWLNYNTFRANRQGERPLNAPDVEVTSLQVNAILCPPQISLQATVTNAGVSAIGPGLPVTLYVSVAGGDYQVLQTVVLEEPISPGGVRLVPFEHQVPATWYNQDLAFRVVANDDGEGGAPVADCNPDNREASIEGISCVIEL